MQVANTSFMPAMQASNAPTLASQAAITPEVAKDFEALFASMLLKEMRKTLADGLFGSESSDVYGGLFDLHMGEAISEGRGLGIKELILAQMPASNQPGRPQST